MDRKTFLKSSCFAGTCLCGFGSVSLAADSSSNTSEETDLFRSWISTLLDDLSGENREKLRSALKNASMAHYDYLNMDEKLEPYRGRMKDFIGFLESNWGWKVTYAKERRVLVADENKNYCVCPLIQHNKEKNTSILCDCSEGFAEKMFSAVIGHPVSARVMTSVLRGDDSCRYKIDLSEK